MFLFCFVVFAVVVVVLFCFSVQFASCTGDVAVVVFVFQGSLPIALVM